MRLRKKTVIVIAVVTVLVGSIIGGMTNNLLMAKFTQLERENVNQNIQRAINVLSDDLSSLEHTDYDWAAFDDTYQFIQDPQHDQAYIEANPSDPTLTNIGVDVIVYFNQTCNIVYSKALDSNDTGIPVPQETINAILSNPQIINHTGIDSRTQGILALPSGSLMVASDPILTTNGQGPVMGSLVMGRHINDAEVAKLSQTLRLPLTIQDLANPQLPSDFQTALSSMQKNETSYVQPLSNNKVCGYATVDDFSGKPVLMLRVDLPRDIYNEGQESTNYLSLSLALVGIVFGLVVMLLLEKIVLTPISGLEKEVKSISRNPNASKRLKLKGSDELTSLGASVNEMLSALEQNQRLAAIGELTTAIAHDLRNPMQGINAATYYLRKKLGLTSDEKTSRMFELIEKDIRYSDRILSQLLDYSQPITLQLSEAAPEEITKKALSLVRIPEKIEVVNQTKDDFKIRVDMQKMPIVLAHLFENAVEAMPQGGKLTITNETLHDGVAFSITDTGVGMSRESLSKIWSPLFTTKAKGMGLSLAVSKRLVEAHNGKISAASTPNKGTTFTITIPAEKTPISDREGKQKKQ